MRRKLIEADVIECVLGLGPNLFYNSPMEACIVICRTAKPKPRKGRILFINAVNEVTRERAQSFLTDDHIERVVAAYREFKVEPGFTRVVSLEEIGKQSGNLNIPMYVGAAEPATGSKTAGNGGSFVEGLSAWLASAAGVRASLNTVLNQKIGPGNLPVLSEIAKTLPPWLKRNKWKRLPFGTFADSIGERVEPATAAEEIYVGLDDLDSGNLHVQRWGKGSDVIGTKLRFQKGDIIFGRRRAYQRKLAVAVMDGICSAHAMVVRAKPDFVLPEFLPFLMMSDRFMTRAVEISVGSLSPTINWTTLKHEEFDLPPIDQQRRIAEILWAVDEVLCKASVTEDYLWSLSKKLLETLFKYCGEGAQETSFGSIKPGWRQSTMEEEGEVQLGQQKHPKFDRGSNIRPYLRVDNVRDGWIDQSNILQMHFPENELAKFELACDDILLNEGQTREYLGRSAIYRGEIPGCCFQKTLIRFRCGKTLIPEFTQSFFRFLLYSGFFASHAAQTAIAHITAFRFKRMPIPVPPQAEQEQIVERIKEIECAKRIVGSHIGFVLSLRASLGETLL